jgi:hypothetical protein
MIFERVPYKFIGIQLRGIRRQVEKSQFAFCIADKLSNLLRAVTGMIVGNQKDRSRGIWQATGQETHKTLQNEPSSPWP